MHLHRPQLGAAAGRGGHLLLLNGVHAGQAADRLVESNRSSAFPRRVELPFQFRLLLEQVGVEHFMLLRSQFVHALSLEHPTQLRPNAR